MQKILSRTIRKSTLVVVLLCFTFLLAGAGQAVAREGHRSYKSQYNYRNDSNHRDRSVYRDRYGNYHRYETRNHHRGYWHHNNGIRFWVNLF